jgi:hypothetical protein
MKLPFMPGSSKIGIIYEKKIKQAKPAQFKTQLHQSSALQKPLLQA